MRPDPRMPPDWGPDHKPVMCPDRESNWQPFALLDNAQRTKPHWSGYYAHFIDEGTEVQLAKVIQHVAFIRYSCWLAGWLAGWVGEWTNEWWTGCIIRTGSEVWKELLSQVEKMSDLEMKNIGGEVRGQMCPVISLGLPHVL